MIKKIIVVGTTTQNNKIVNGQSMMFQLFVDNLKKRKIETIVVDFGKSFQKKFGDKRVSGEFNIIKLIDNFFLSITYFFILLFNPNTPVYINTSQSKVGFIRDYIFINLAKIFGRKVVAHQFGANYKKFFNSQSSFFQKLITNVLQKTDKIVVEGDFTKRQFNFLLNFEEKVISIPNGLPEKINSSLISAKNIIANEPIKLLYLSNMIESKGFWDVLEAANILINQHKKNIDIVFSGKFLASVDDEKFIDAEVAKKSFFEYVKKNNLTEKITYFEGLYGNEKSVAFRNSHFFLLPSYYINEGQPVSVLESLAYGCVPIVTRYRLIPTMVNEENGFFVEPKSPIQIVECILEIIDNPMKYHDYSQAGINYYLDNFTQDKYVNKLINLF